VSDRGLEELWQSIQYKDAGKDWACNYPGSLCRAVVRFINMLQALEKLPSSKIAGPGRKNMAIYESLNCESAHRGLSQ
jgi:hypothetical protein